MATSIPSTTPATTPVTTPVTTPAASQNPTAGIPDSSSSGSTAVSGLSSGIDSQSIINALIAASNTANLIVQKRRDAFQKQQDEVKALNVKLLSTQLDLTTLKRPSSFQATTATSSNATVLGATTNGSVVAGTYTFDVTSIAQAHQLAAAGQSSATANLGAGSVTLQVGSGAATTLNFDSANSSLTSIAAAITNANLGVTATVINDGSGATSNRLVLKSNTTGLSNAITVSSTGLPVSPSGSLFDAANLTTLSAASDAKIKIGGGVGGTALEITRSNNTFSDVVPGLTLTTNALATGVSVTVGTDTTGVKSNITTFVKDLNDVISYFNQNSSYDSATGTAGALIAENDVHTGINRIKSALNNIVPGLPQTLNNLTSIGITFDQDNGTLVVDDKALDAALAANPDGVGKLFSNSGTSSNGAVQFATLSGKTNTSISFHVNVTTVATQAVAGTTGTMASEPIAIDGSDNALTLTVNGVTKSLTLVAGNYTQQALSAHIQALANTAFGDNQVLVSASGGALDLRTRNYGSGQSIQVLGGSANSVLNLATTKTFGVDVAGTINGVKATGTGQVMFGADGSDAEGLGLVIKATAPISNVVVNASKGLAESTSEQIEGLTNSTTGVFVQKDDSLSTIIDSLNAQIVKNNNMLQQRRDYLTAQFTNMEKLIQGFKSQGNFITSQIASMQASTATNK